MSWIKNISQFLQVTGFLDRYPNLAIPDQRLLVLNLHRVIPREKAQADQESSYKASIDPRELDELIQSLAKSFSITSFSELSMSPQSTHKPLLVFSFDDGTRDFIEYAMPVFHKHKLRPNQNFVIKAALEKRPFWNIELSDFIWNADLSLLKSLAWPGFTFQSRRGALSHIQRTTKYLQKDVIREALGPVFQAMRSADFKRTQMLSVQDLQSVKNDCELGAHSFEHDSFQNETDVSFQSDFRLCQDFFKSTLGLDLNIYAFPNGSYRHSQVEWLKSQISTILLVGEKSNSLSSECLSGHPPSRVFWRLTLYGDSVPELKLRAFFPKKDLFFRSVECL